MQITPHPHSQNHGPRHPSNVAPVTTSAFLLFSSPLSFSHRHVGHPPPLSSHVVASSISFHSLPPSFPLLSLRSSLFPHGGDVVPLASSSWRHPPRCHPRGVIPGLDAEEGCFEDALDALSCLAKEHTYHPALPHASPPPGSATYQDGPTRARGSPRRLHRLTEGLHSMPWMTLSGQSTESGQGRAGAPHGVRQWRRQAGRCSHQQRAGRRRGVGPTPPTRRGELSHG